jgi:hypothetical protein
MLKNNQWFSPPTKLYVHTLIWITIFLVSRRFLLRKHFSLMPIGVGLGQNTYILWDMYHLLGCERCGVEKIRVADVVAAGAFTAVAVGGNHYIAARFWRAAEEVDEVKGGKGQSDTEKA